LQRDFAQEVKLNGLGEAAVNWEEKQGGETSLFKANWGSKNGPNAKTESGETVATDKWGAKKSGGNIAFKDTR